MVSTPLLWQGIEEGFQRTLPKFSSPLHSAERSWDEALSQWRGDISRMSAVAVLFALPEEVKSSADLVLTRRSAKVGSHKRQISFAGGRRDPCDASPAQTAIRECIEELGLGPKELVVHGLLPPIPSLDRNPVVPVLMTSRARPDEAKIQTSEVEALHLVPWTEFQPAKRQIVEFNIFGLKRRTYLYPISDLRLWGLTAQIVAEANFANSPERLSE